MHTNQFILAATLSLGMALPSYANTLSHFVPAEPDSTITDDNALVVDGEYDDEDWTGADADATDSAANEANDVLCPTDDELLTQFGAKNADYETRDPNNPDASASFNAVIYYPADASQRAAYAGWVSHLLVSGTDAADDVAKWKTDDLEKILELRWKQIKAAYSAEVKDLKKNWNAEDGEIPTLNHSFRIAITPCWQWEAKGLTTYRVENESYTGGAHGYGVEYYATFNTATGQLLSLTDIFTPEGVDRALALVGEKLAARRVNTEGADAWEPVPELKDYEPGANFDAATASAVLYNGKYYPRPALTECGVVFSYAPYEKDCYAAGNIHILLTNEEIANCLKK